MSNKLLAPVKVRDSGCRLYFFLSNVYSIIFKGCQIEVFGRHCWQIPRVLWSFSARDATLSLLVEPDESKKPMRVFASHANGTVTVFQRTPYNGANYPNATSASGADEDAAIEIEKNEWQETTVCNFIIFSFLRNNLTFYVKSNYCRKI